jgi:purine catabolism regulator
MLTVGELLRDLDLRLLAGEGGADAPLRWVHISELRDPTPWLSGGELLLTTGMRLDTSEAQREFVERLADHKLAAIGVGTGLGHDTVPEPLLEAAAERDLPVFEVPYEVPFIAITEAAFTRLVNEQYAVLRGAIAAHERLERIVLSERGLDALAKELSSIVGGAVVIFDGRGELLVDKDALDQESASALQAEVREKRRDARAFVPLGGAGLALPVTSEGVRTPEAWLVAIKDAGSLSDLDRLTLHQAVTIVALELLRGRVVEETERRLAGDVLHGVVSGELVGTELAHRLEPFGLADQVATLVSDVAVVGSLAAALRDEGTAALVAATRGLACALVPGFDEEELFALARRVAKRLSPERIGVGRAVGSGQARRSFHEARCALEAASLAGLNGTGVATYRDLGSFQLLLSLQDDEALRLFCDSILGPIESSEGRYGGELMRSLEAFIECNGQWEHAARKLYCHRHTLRYRMKRVEELTGRSLQNARDRIDFWLALRGRELVS